MTHTCYCVTEHNAPLKRMECATPEPKGAEVLIRMTGAGLCHSDIHIWEGTYDLGSGPRVFPQQQEANYPLSNCISCTCSMEVCPQFNTDTGFVGAATIAQVKLFNNHPTGKVFKEDRLRALAGDGGIQECGFAQNCVEACPKQLPLTEAISDISRDVLIQKAKDFLRG